jgi:hypothetical protein
MIKDCKRKEETCSKQTLRKKQEVEEETRSEEETLPYFTQMITSGLNHA